MGKKKLTKQERIKEAKKLVNELDKLNLSIQDLQLLQAGIDRAQLGCFFCMGEKKLKG
jgi:hypothetical protein